MIFSDTTLVQEGLIQECEDLCNLGVGGISGNTNLLKRFTARINGAIDRFYALAFRYDLNWNFDGSNQTDLPIATVNIVSGQQDYTFASELLMVTQVFAKDSNGTFHELTEQDDKNAPNVYLTTTSGVPTRYELVGNSILLDAIPNYNSTAGLKVTFKRNGVKFTYSDGAIAIGIPSLFHHFLARYASYSFLVSKGLKHAGAIGGLVVQDEMAIKEFIANRAKPKRMRMTVNQESNR